MIRKLWNELFLLNPPVEQLVFKTKYTTQECLEKLSENMDDEQPTLFSLSGYQGEKQMIGKIWGVEFYVHWRTYLRNDFKRYFFGIVVDDPNGARVVGVFDVNRYAKNFVRLWVGLVLVFTAILLFGLLTTLAVGAPEVGPFAFGLLVTSLMLAFGYFFPRLGAIAQAQERQIMDSLQTVLMSRPERQA